MIPVDVHLRQSDPQFGQCLRMRPLKLRQGHQLSQTGTDKGEHDTSLNGGFRFDLIVIKAERLFAVPECGFNSPSQVVVVDDGFN